MKHLTNLFIIVFFILTAVKVADAQTNFKITGKARYADTYEIVRSGEVRLYNLDGTVDAVGQINQNGDWIIIPMIVGDKDLIGFPGIGNEMDFMPTSTEQRVIPSEFVHIRVDKNITGVEILVKRHNGNRPIGSITSVSGLVLNENGQPVKDAVVYLQSGSDYFAHGVTNAKGEYTVKNVPTGDFILVAHKVGSESDSKNITIGETDMGSINFIVSSLSKGTNNPFAFSLEQNYPNPFNPNTVISYTLPADGLVSLKVFNTLGQQVSELINNVQNAGGHTVEFNAQNLSSGIYYYKLESNGFVDTKKMILVK